MIWRDAATGEIVAESDFFPTMSPGIPVTLGYDGFIYDMLYNCLIMALQVALSALTTAGNNTTTSLTVDLCGLNLPLQNHRFEQVVKTYSGRKTSE
jgi:hypothetical protein